MLKQVLEEDGVPKNIRMKLRCVSTTLGDGKCALSLRVDKTIQELDEIAEDQFVPVDVRTKIWGIVSRLECI
jgi:uncharacterized protein (UPF0147 family)